MSYFELWKCVDSVYDDNTLKIGRYTHHNYQIKPTSQIYVDKPDYLIILSWNYQDELMKKHSEFQGKFIIPLPKLLVI